METINVLLTGRKWQSQNEFVYEILRLSGHSNMTNYEVIEFCKLNGLTFDDSPITDKRQSGIRRTTCNLEKANLVGNIQREDTAGSDSRKSQVVSAYFVKDKSAKWGEDQKNLMIRVSEDSLQTNSKLKKEFGKMMIGLLDIPDYAFINKEFKDLSKDFLLLMIKLECSRRQAAKDGNTEEAETNAFLLADYCERYGMNKATSDYKDQLADTMMTVYKCCLDDSSGIFTDKLEEMSIKFNKFNTNLQEAILEYKETIII